MGGDASKVLSATEKITKELDEDHQHDSLNNMKISAIPESKTENIYKTVISLANAIGVPMEERDIDSVHRIPSASTNIPTPVIAMQMEKGGHLL